MFLITEMVSSEDSLLFMTSFERAWRVLGVSARSAWRLALHCESLKREFLVQATILHESSSITSLQDPTGERRRSMEFH
jgi:hypothetical protein